MNPRRLVVEDQVLTLATRLESAGQQLLAGRLREVVPESYALADEHLPMLKDRLHAVRVTGGELAGSAERILVALEDLPTALGRRGTVWARWQPEGFDAYWAEDDWLEAAPRGLGLRDVLAWAHRRAERVLVCPEWDEHTFYSAGKVRDPDHPLLDPDGR